MKIARVLSLSALAAMPAFADRIEIDSETRARIQAIERQARELKEYRPGVLQRPILVNGSPVYIVTKEAHPCVDENQALDKAVFDFFFKPEKSGRGVDMIFEPTSPAVCEEWFDERAGKPAAIRTYRGNKSHDLVLVTRMGSPRTDIAVVWVSGIYRRVAGTFASKDVGELLPGPAEMQGYLYDFTAPPDAQGIHPARTGTAVMKARQEKP